MRITTRICIILLGCLCCNTVWPQTAREPEYLLPEDSAVAAKLRQWQDWKFGVIIHWGPYSQWGVVESWSLCPEDEPWCVRRGPYAEDYHTYVKAYESLPGIFDPEQFNPVKWAAACANAGMKYVVFTTKHHDGFCMFDSRYTDYKITGPASVFAKNPRANISLEVFNAFRNKGMGAGVYFSKPDWHHPDYWWPYFPVFDRNVNYNPEKYPERWQRFKTFTHQQVEELMSGYGRIDILWLDGGWVRPAGSLTEETRPWLGKNQWIQDADIPAMAAMARKYQPGLLVVDRTVHGPYENYRTPEQQIPEHIPPYPWESCITLGDSWYSSGPGERYKTAHWVVHTLVKIVSMGGNFLLGIGPDKTGDLVPAVYRILEETGRWVQQNGEAVYGSIPLAPYSSGNICFTQSKDGKRRYAIILLKEGESLPESVSLPADFTGQKTGITLPGWTGKLQYHIRNEQAIIRIPPEFRKLNKTTPALVLRVIR